MEIGTADIGNSMAVSVVLSLADKTPFLILGHAVNDQLGEFV
jgi:hypothetical protein